MLYSVLSPLLSQQFAKRLSLGALFLFVCLPSVLKSPGAILSWSGGGGANANWNASANWGFAGTPTNGDTLIFSASQPNLLNTNNIAGLTINQIRFVGTGGGYDIRGNAFTLTNNIEATNSAGANTIENNITLSATDQVFEVTTMLTLSGAVGGSVGVTKIGAGILLYQGVGNNTYSGTTRINAGTLQLNVGGFHGFGGPLVIGDGSGTGSPTVRLLQGLEIDQTFPIRINLNGLLDLNNFSDMIGDLTIQGGTASSGLGTLTINGNVTTLASGTSATISGNVSFVGGAPTITVADGAAFYDFYLPANVTDNGFGLLFTNYPPGASFARLTGSNNLTGPIVVNNLQVAEETSYTLGLTNPVTVGGAGTLWLYSSGYTNKLLNLQGGALIEVQNASIWSGPVVLTNGYATFGFFGAGSTLAVIGSISGPGGFIMAGPGTLTLAGNVNNPYIGQTFVNDGTMNLTKTGGAYAIGYGALTIGDGVGAAASAVVREFGNNEILLVPVILNSDGLLDLNGNNDLVGTTVTLNGGANIQNTSAGTLTLIDGSTLGVFSGSSTISGNLNIGSTNSSTCTWTQSFDGTLYMNASVIGDANIVEAGNGSVFLTASNAFTGQFTVNAGFIGAWNSFALGSTAGGTTLNGSAELGICCGGVNIPNESLTLNNPGGYVLCNGGSNSWAGPVILNANATFYVNCAGCYLNLLGAISGSGGFTKLGQGNLILSGPANSSSYLGDTAVNEGILFLNSLNVIRHGTLTIGDGVGGPDADVVRYMTGGAIYGGAGGSQVFIQRSGLLDLNGFTDDVGPIAMDAGHISTGVGFLQLFSPLTTISSTNGAAIFDGNLTVRSDSFLGITNNLVMNAAVGGSLSYTLTKAGGGILYLESSNSYPGLTVVQEGILWAYNPWALGTTNSGTVVSNNATLAMSGANMGITNESLVLNGVGVTLYGNLDSENNPGTNIWAGPITVNGNCTISPYWSNTVLRIIGPISGPGGVQFYGGGSNWGLLTFEGTNANTYAGTTTVPTGTLLLDKTAGLNAISNSAVSGTLRLAADQQIALNADMLVNAGGLFDLGAYSEYIGTLHGLGTVNFGSGGWIYLGNGDGSSTFDGPFTGIGYAPGFTVGKTGTGSFTMNGNNTFSAGATHIYQGKLVINGAQPQSPVLVENGSILGGTGTVGDIVSAGTVSPGASPGVLTGSNVTFTAAGSYIVDLTGPNPGLGGYDQLNVRGTNNLANAGLTILPAFTNPVVLGQQFVIVNNDGVDPVVGTFNGLPEGATIVTNGFNFKLSYVGGDGNDVVLTLTNVPAAQAGYAVSLGNGNGTIDPNECNYINIVITNQFGGPMTGISATLLSTTPNVAVTQPLSPYADVPGHGKGTNTVPFQISTTTNFVCGATVNLQLTLATASHGSFTIPLTLSSGSPAVVPVRYDNNTVTNIPDIGTIESTNIVSAFSGTLEKVAVSLWLTHPVDSDLTLSLISPDGTLVTLVSATGGGANFGSACSPDANRTTFDDAAATSISAGTPPFVGTFRPQGSLASFINRTANGNWRLRITDGFGGSLGALRCWSLFLYPPACAPGSGQCELCPNTLITGAMGLGTPTQTNLVNFNGIPSACGAPKVCPGTVIGGPWPYDNYVFRNGPSDACISVVLENDSSGIQMLATVYSGSYNPAATNKCLNYLADGGNIVYGGTSQGFSFNVASNAPFVVNLIASTAGITPYRLSVSGGDCRPVLNISPAGANNVQLDWTTAAAGFRLERTNTLASGVTNWPPVTNIPVIVNSRFRVTNSAAIGNQFYRLHKP